MTAITIRPETRDDIATIHAITAAAFAGKPFSDGSEPDIITSLREADDLTLSLVAEDEERMLGHIAFSPVTISDGAERWYGLGPISVLPEFQGQGIGFRLMQRGLADMRELGARGLVLLGDPEYYSRFGFEHDPKLAYPGPPAEYFQRLVFEGEAPSGTVSYAPAFG